MLKKGLDKIDLDKRNSDRHEAVMKSIERDVKKLQLHEGIIAALQEQNALQKKTIQKHAIDNEHLQKKLREKQPDRVWNSGKPWRKNGVRPRSCCEEN